MISTKKATVRISLQTNPQFIETVQNYGADRTENIYDYRYIYTEVEVSHESQFVYIFNDSHIINELLNKKFFKDRDSNKFYSSSKIVSMEIVE